MTPPQHEARARHGGDGPAERADATKDAAASGAPPEPPSSSAREVEPSDWPWSLGGRAWWAVLRDVATELGRDNLTLLAAGVAFFGFLAIFPALAALVAIYGLVFDPANVESQMIQLRGLLPPAVLELLGRQLERLTAAAPDSLSLGAVVAVAVAVWSANRGSTGIIAAINLAYCERETRGVVRLYLTALVLTVGSLVLLSISIAVAVGVPTVLQYAGLDEVARVWLDYGRWPLLVVVLLLGVAVVYAFAPDRRRPSWRWISPGSVLATAGLLAASAGFSLYVSRFTDYNEIYGSVGAVAVFLLWLYLASFVVLLGAELNAVLERHVARLASVRS